MDIMLLVHRGTPPAFHKQCPPTPVHCPERDTPVSSRTARQCIASAVLCPTLTLVGIFSALPSPPLLAHVYVMFPSSVAKLFSFLVILL